MRLAVSGELNDDNLTVGDNSNVPNNTEHKVSFWVCKICYIKLNSLVKNKKKRNICNISKQSEI